MWIAKAIGMSFFCLGLGSCDGRHGTRDSGAGTIDCAIGGDGNWRHACTIEKHGDLLTVRHEDGGFRRLRIVHDGRGLEAADGAEGAKVVIVDKGRIELSVGNERYRFPATMAEAVR